MEIVILHVQVVQLDVKVLVIVVVLKDVHLMVVVIYVLEDVQVVLDIVIQPVGEDAKVVVKDVVILA